MSRLLLSASVAWALLVASGCVPINGSPPFRPPALHGASHEKQQNPPGGIDDLKKIPQDVSSFAQAIQSPLTQEQQVQALQQFRERYFAPWSAGQFSLGRSIQGMTDMAQKTWFGENHVRVDPKSISAMLADAALDQIPSRNQPGIVIAPTFMRALPQAKPWYDAADDFPFDQLQYTELKPNEPVRILHESLSGAWLFVESAHVQGWVAADAVVPVDASVQEHLSRSDWVVVVRDFPVLRDERGKAVPQPKVGTVYPIVREEHDAWLVGMAAPGPGDYAVLKPVRIAKGDARRFPLPLTAETATLLGNELLKGSYGWGEVFRDRDCSATTRDFFLPFGIWLPRNSLKQINIGAHVSLSGLTATEKKRLLGEQGVPFRTLVHSPGHIMLYLGLFEGQPVILHNTWAIRFNNPQGQEDKLYIGKTVISTLEPGAELALSRGPLVSHIDAILQLPAMQPPGR